MYFWQFNHIFNSYEKSCLPEELKGSICCFATPPHCCEAPEKARIEEARGTHS